MSRHNSPQRQRLLEAAVAVFAEHGLEGATTRRLAQAAELNSALIYYYFEDKETLFVETVHFVLRSFLAHLASQRGAFPTARARVEFLVDGLFAFHRVHPERFRLLSRAINFHPELFASLLPRLAREPVLVPLDVLQEGMTTGQFKTSPALPIWWSILGMCLFNFQMRLVLSLTDWTQLPAALVFGKGVGAASLPGLEKRQRETIVELLTFGLAQALGSEDRNATVRAQASVKRNKTNPRSPGKGVSHRAAVL
jgi:TetR/AcrR family transcriptional regulator